MYVAIYRKCRGWSRVGIFVSFPTWIIETDGSAIALSVRSTNVYEEQSLGVFEKEESDEEPLLKGKDDIFG